MTPNRSASAFVSSTERIPSPSSWPACCHCRTGISCSSATRSGWKRVPACACHAAYSAPSTWVRALPPADCRRCSARTATFPESLRFAAGYCDPRLWASFTFWLFREESHFQSDLDNVLHLIFVCQVDLFSLLFPCLHSLRWIHQDSRCYFLARNI